VDRTRPLRWDLTALKCHLQKQAKARRNLEGGVKIARILVREHHRRQGLSVVTEDEGREM